MANQVTFKEVLDQINDYGQNYTATTIDKGNVKRAANRAFEHVQSRLGLPSDIDTFDFEYYQDTNLYDCPDDFNELIQLYYNTDQSDITVDLNTPAHRWNIAKDTEILRSTGSRNVNSGYQWNGPSSNQVALTRINGKNQLLLKGSNSNGIQLINSFDTTTGLTFSSDIANQAADSNVKKQGNASIKFDITAGQTSSSISMTGNWNIQNSITNVAAYRAYVYFPTTLSTTDITSVQLKLTSTTGNYYLITSTDQVDGSAWASNAWSWLDFPLDSLSTVGSPDSQSITQIDVIFNHGSSVTVSNMRIDYLYLVTPDYLTCSYYSFNKGTDSTGVTKKVILTEDTDICSFGAVAPSLIDPIAIRAALKLFPQLRGDTNFWNMYKSDYEDTMKVLGRTFPRHRSTGSAGQTELLR